MKCNNCNNIIPDDSKFCKFCGAKIAVENSTIECPSCHNHIPADSKFCPDCGTKLELEDISSFAYIGTFSDGLAPAIIGNRGWAYINKNFEIIIFGGHDWLIACPFENNRAIVVLKNGNKLGIIDELGNYIIKPERYEYNSLYTKMSEGFVNAVFGGKYLFINASNGSVIKGTYDKTLPFHNDLAAVCINEKWGFIDKSGNNVIPCSYDSVSAFAEGLAIVTPKDYGYNSKVIDKSENTLVVLSERNNYYDWKDEISFSSGLALVKGEYKGYNFINAEGDYLLDEDVEEARPFHEGIAAINKDGEGWVFINRYGEIIIDGENIKENLGSGFSKVNNFHEGFAAVELNGKSWGCIDRNGNVIIPFRYDSNNVIEEGIMKDGMISFSYIDHEKQIAAVYNKYGNQLI